MPSSSPFDAVLSALTRPGGAVPPELVGLLTGLLKLLESLPPGADLFAALKRAGAWRDKPLPPNLPEQPYYVTVPIAIEIENLSPAALAADLHRYPVVPDGLGTSKITIPAPAR